MKPAVSIIVPVYNGEKTLERCVDSVLKQEYKDLSVTDILTGVWNKTACEKEAESCDPDRCPV